MRLFLWYVSRQFFLKPHYRRGGAAGWKRREGDTRRKLYEQACSLFLPFCVRRLSPKPEKTPDFTLDEDQVPLPSGDRSFPPFFSFFPFSLFLVWVRGQRWTNQGDDIVEVESNFVPMIAAFNCYTTKEFVSEINRTSCEVCVVNLFSTVSRKENCRLLVNHRKTRIVKWFNTKDRNILYCINFSCSQIIKRT